MKIDESARYSGEPRGSAPATGGHNGSAGVANDAVNQLLVSQLTVQRELAWCMRVESAREMQSRLQRMGMPLLSDLDSAPLPVKVNGHKAGWTYSVALDFTTGEHHAALVFGNLAKGALGDGQDVLVRLHSSSKLSDIFAGKNGNSRAKLEAAMKEIERRGSGVLLYLEQDGRDHGVEVQARAMAARYEFGPDGRIVESVDQTLGRSPTVAEAFAKAGLASDGRDYAVAAEFLKRLGVKSICLTTNEPGKAEALSRHGLAVRHLETDAFYRPVEVAVAHAALGEVALERERLELDTWCRQLQLDAHTPWEVVRKNGDLLAAAGVSRVKKLATAPLPTEHGDWTVIYYGDYSSGDIHRVLVYGDALGASSLGDGENVLTRVHSACKTNEIFHATNCECRPELMIAMQAIQKEGRGLIIYLDQEGRGTGIRGKMAQLRGMFEFDEAGGIRAKLDEAGREIQTAAAYERAGFPKEVRDFSVVLDVLGDLGVRSLRLMTNNPRKLDVLAGRGLPSEAVPIVVPAELVDDPTRVCGELQNKGEALGHRIDAESLRAAGYKV